MRLALFSPDGLLICTAGSGAVRVWEAASGKPHGPGWKPLHATRTAEFNTDGSRLLLVDAEDRATVFETATGRALLGPIQPPVDADGGRNHLFPLSPDGRRIAVTGGLSGALLLYEVASGTHYPTPIVGGIVARSEFSPDSRRLLTAASDTLARTWDAATGKPTGPPLRHPSFVRWAAFSPDGRLIVTRDDLVTRVWDGNTGDLVIPPLPRSEPAIFQVWFSKDGRRLIGQSPEGPVYQWELPAFRTAPDHVQALVHLLAGRQIDATDGVAPLDPQTFRKSPEEYRRAWLSWRGLDSESGSSQH